MGNAGGKEEVEKVNNNHVVRSDGHPGSLGGDVGGRRNRAVDAMGGSPPESPGRSRSPLMFAPQVPVAPLQRPSDIPPTNKQLWINDDHYVSDATYGKGIPTLITWNYGGNSILLEGSWDNWTSRKALQRSGKDHSILLVLPSGIYQYRFIVDGQWRYLPELPFVTNEMGHFNNIIDVNEYVPEDLQSVSEFESPPSPDNSYGRPFPVDEDFAKEPPAVPPQLHLTVLGSQKLEEAFVKPQHVVLNHLFIEKGWSSQSLVPLGFTHRFQSKYVTVVLYKAARR
ncbi:hypothetical protein HPP92_000620 [Vanilla planifolia]|uniref:Association with the SNF1 complex (ASC) domain-containing protein n=1 Tax=Vanilla planifolia TaxID=51239 RepID=A0A835S0Z0_VANPL|nr:hypothetical protein HPP92_000697 [Vanilla planifolia]KAG0500548.1 hypothetical protein HPP92_000620 [Vanilla planifolia]